MATIRINRPSSGLMVGAGIARGAANMVSAFTQAQANKAEQARRNAELALRQQQMQLLREEMNQKYGPVKISLQKMGLLENLARGGVDVPNSVTGKVWNELMDQVGQTPEVIPALNQSARARASRQFGLPEVARYEQQSPVPDPLYPNSGADTQLNLRGMEINSPTPRRQQPDEIELSRAEYDLFADTKKAAAQERVAQTRGVVQLQAAQLQNMSRAQLEALQRETQIQLEALKQQGANQRAAEQNATTLRAAKISASARQQTNTPAQLDRKSILSQIETLQKQKGDLYKPNSLGMTMPPAMAKQQEAWYDQQIGILNQQLRSMPAAPAAPAKPAAKSAAPKKGAAPPAKQTGLPKTWDPIKEPNRIQEFKKGDIIDVTSGPGAGKRVKITTDQGDFEEVQ